MSDKSAVQQQSAQRLLSGQAWEDYCDGERPLAPAIKRLGKAKQAA